MKCGNCNNDHDTAAQVKECFGSGGSTTTTTTTAQRPAYQPNMEMVRTVTCASPACKATKTGPVKDLLGWRCDEHPARSVPVEGLDDSDNTIEGLAIGDKVLYSTKEGADPKRFEILEIGSDDKAGQIRLRTGGNGRWVAIDDITI